MSANWQSVAFLGFLAVLTLLVFAASRLYLSAVRATAGLDAKRFELIQAARRRADIALACLKHVAPAFKGKLEAYDTAVETLRLAVREAQAPELGRLEMTITEAFTALLDAVRNDPGLAAQEALTADFKRYKAHERELALRAIEYNEAVAKYFRARRGLLPQIGDALARTTPPPYFPYAVEIPGAAPGKPRVR